MNSEEVIEWLEIQKEYTLDEGCVDENNDNRLEALTLAIDFLKAKKERENNLRKQTIDMIINVIETLPIWLADNVNNTPCLNREQIIQTMEEMKK